MFYLPVSLMGLHLFKPRFCGLKAILIIKCKLFRLTNIVQNKYKSFRRKKPASDHISVEKMRIFELPILRLNSTQILPALGQDKGLS